MTEIKSTPLNFYTMMPSFKANQNIQDDKSIPAEISDVLEKIKNAKNYEEFWTIIDEKLNQNPEFEKIDDNTFKKGEFYIKASAEFEKEYTKEVLNGLKEKGINFTPEYVDSASTKEGFSVTVLKIKGTNTGDLIDYNKGKNLLSEEAKKEAYIQFQKLTKLGIANLEVLNNSNLKITPDYPHKVVVTDWSDLCPVEEYLAGSMDNSRMTILEKIHNVIFKK